MRFSIPAFKKYSRRLLPLFMCFMLVFVNTLNFSLASALSPQQRALLNKGVYYYDLACRDTAPVSAGSGDAEGTIFPNLDPAAMADAINRFIERENSNSELSGLGETIVAGAENSNISPFLIVAHAHAESGLADPGDYNVSNGNNAFGRTATTSQPNFSGARLWYKWTSVKASVDHTAEENQGAVGGGDIAAYIREQYPDVIDRGDLEAYLLEYVADGNEGWYGQLVTKDVREMARMTGGSSAGGGSGSLTADDLSKIADDFNLHSAVVKELGGDVTAAYRANQQSNTSPGSLKKLLIADAFLSTNPNLGKTITVKSQHLYGDGSPRGTIWDPKAGDRTTLKKSLLTTLRNSSNSQANVLIEETGGPGSVNQKTQNLGYNNSSNVGSYFKFDGSGGPSSRSTANDITKAMEKIFNSRGNKYAVAQEGLRSSTYSFGLNSIANKWGGHSSFTGNSAIFQAGSKKYIITLFMEAKWDDDIPDYNYDAPSTSPSVGKIKQATKKILQELGGDTQAQQGTGGCACTEDGGISASGSISSEVGKGMSNKQEFQELVVAAAEKYDMDSNYLATFYFIENNGHVKSLDEGSWREPAPPYGNGDPWPTSYAGAKGPWQFIDSTWDAYGADGNNDGNKNVNDLKDATFGAANYLAALGGKKNANDQKLRDAAYGYNHSDDYVDSIMKIYEELSNGSSSTVSGSGGCPGGVGSSASCEQPSGSPKDVIDNVAIPIAKDLGFSISVESVETANAAHSYTTTSGNVSDHSGPPERAWAADISNGTNPTPEMDKLAEELSSCFGIPWSGSGAISHSESGYRYQIIYRSNVGGNHYNHVHIGVAAE